MLTWADVLEPDARLFVENRRLGAELYEFGNATIARDGDHRDRARWALNLADRGLVRLNKFGRSFLETIKRWHGTLTDEQQPIWSDLLPEIARRSGRTPP